MTYTTSERHELLKKIPWVTYVKKGERCKSLRSGSPLKAYCGDKNGPIDTEKYQCRNMAHWKFKALKKSHAYDGFYCKSHLMSRGIYCDTDEMERTNKWLDEWKDLL